MATNYDVLLEKIRGLERKIHTAFFFMVSLLSSSRAAHEHHCVHGAEEYPDVHPGRPVQHIVGVERDAARVSDVTAPRNLP